MPSEKTLSKVFSAPKVHSKTRVTRLTAEVAILIVVLVGTAITFLCSANFSWQKVFENTKEALSLKKQNKETKGLSFEEQIRALTDGKVINIASLEESPQGYLSVTDKDGLVVIFSRDKDLETQVSTLQTLLSKAKIEKRAFSLVDFRFDKLVVRYK